MKKTIYSILTFVLIILLGTSIQSCKSDSYVSPLHGQSIGDISLGSSMDSKNISIGSNSDLSKITASSSADWCSAIVSPTSINVSVQANDTYEERKASILLADSEDGTTLSFNVIQKQNDAVITDKQSYSISSSGGTITIEIKSNVDYTVEIPSDCNWLTYKAGSRGLTTSSLSFTAPKNDSGDKREAVVKLKKADSEVLNTFKITQKFTPRIKIENDEFTVYENGGVLDIPFSSNVEIKVKNDYSWIKNEGITKISEGNYSLKLKIDANLNSTESRKGVVYLESANPNWDTSETIIINQIHSLSISPTEIALMEDDTYSLQLTNNTGQSVKWSSSNTSVATVNSSGVVTGVGKGNATITVKTADGKFSAKATVAVGDITNLITARSGASSIMMVNNLIQYGSSLGWIFTNKSSRTVKLKSLQLVDGATGSEGNIMNVNAEVAGGSSVSYSTTIGLLGIHTPVTCRFRYEYKGKEYMTTAVFLDSLW